jgi:Ca-activated chloride channel family protein
LPFPGITQLTEIGLPEKAVLWQMIASRVSRFHDTHLIESVSRSQIPTQALVNGSIFDAQYFDINPDREEITDPVLVKTFSSKFINPISGSTEQLLVLGLTGSEDGQNRRRKTDFVLVIDRSGSMESSLDNYDSDPAAQSSSGDRSKMSLTIAATKRIFDFIEADEKVGICTFDSIAEIVQDLKLQGEIQRESLFAQLDTITARGSTNFEPPLKLSLSLLKDSGTPNRNQRIIFLTDAIPTYGPDTNIIRDWTEAAFVESGGLIGVTYIGIGLSFDAETCAKLTAAHGTSVYSASNTTQLDAFINSEFNYLVSPVAFDVRISLSSTDYTIGEIFGGDIDCKKDPGLFEFRTMTASSVNPDGVKGSALVLYLNPVSDSPPEGAGVQLVVEWTLLGGKKETRTLTYVLTEEPLPLTEKAFALSVYYRTLRQVLPQSRGKEKFTVEEGEALRKLLAFLNSQPPPIAAAFQGEIKIVTDLIAFT